MKREDVEALFVHAKAWGVPGNLSSETLAELCRRWLAVEDAAVYEVAQKDYPAVMGYIGIEVNRELLGQRVRIVPEKGEGDRG